MRLLLTAVAAAMLSSAALAQPPAQPAPFYLALGISPAEIQAMRSLAPQVRQLTLQHQPQINAAADEETRGEAQRNLFGRLEPLVKAQGMTVERYNQIATMAQTNADLARAIGQ